MRKPSEYVAAAKVRLRDSLIPDCSEVMRHGERVATVTRIGSPSIGGEPIMGDEPAENCRVLALISDFPMLAKGEAVEFGDTLRVVTSCTADIVRTGYTVGLSAAFEKCPAAYSGTRREGRSSRQFRHPLNVLALETPSVSFDYGEAAAPSYAQSWIVCIAADSWPEVSPPQVSDAIQMHGTGCNPVSLRISDVKRHDGYWILHARPKGGT